jgi:hypothetical protein
VTQQAWLIDCGHINVLPESFFNFYLRCDRGMPFIVAVATQLNRDLSPSSKLKLLQSACGIVIQSGLSHFGKHQRLCAS